MEIKREDILKIIFIKCDSSEEALKFIKNYILEKMDCYVKDGDNKRIIYDTLLLSVANNISKKKNVGAAIELIKMRCSRHGLNIDLYIDELLFTEKSAKEILDDIALITMRGPVRHKILKDLIS